MTEPGAARTLYFEGPAGVREAQLEMDRRRVDLQTLRETGRYDEPTVDPDAAIRALADRNVNFARANSLLNQGRTLVALEETGRLLTDRFCLEGCLPAEGVELVKAGARWRVASQPSLSLEPMPQWIAALLGGKH